MGEQHKVEESRREGEIVNRLMKLELLRDKDSISAEEWRKMFVTKIDKLQNSIDTLNGKFVAFDKSTCLTNAELSNRILSFEPVRKVVYGMVGLILVSVTTAILALILRKQ